MSAGSSAQIQLCTSYYGSSQLDYELKPQFQLNFKILPMKKGQALLWIAYHVIIQRQQEIRTSTSAILFWSLKPLSKKNPKCRMVWLEVNVWMPLKPLVLRLYYEFSLFVLAFCDTDYMVHVCMHIQDGILQFLSTLHWEKKRAHICLLPLLPPLDRRSEMKTTSHPRSRIRTE